MPPLSYKGFSNIELPRFVAVVILFRNFRYVPVAISFLAYGGVGGINRKMDRSS